MGQDQTNTTTYAHLLTKPSLKQRARCEEGADQHLPFYLAMETIEGLEAKQLKTWLHHTGKLLKLSKLQVLHVRIKVIITVPI